jgi:hypothetical protein
MVQIEGAMLPSLQRLNLHENRAEETSGLVQYKKVEGLRRCRVLAGKASAKDIPAEPRNDECGVADVEFKEGDTVWMSPTTKTLYAPGAIYKWLVSDYPNTAVDPLGKKRIPFSEIKKLHQFLKAYNRRNNLDPPDPLPEEDPNLIRFPLVATRVIPEARYADPDFLIPNSPAIAGVTSNTLLAMLNGPRLDDQRLHGHREALNLQYTIGRMPLYVLNYINTNRDLQGIKWWRLGESVKFSWDYLSMDILGDPSKQLGKNLRRAKEEDLRNALSVEVTLQNEDRLAELFSAAYYSFLEQAENLYEELSPYDQPDSAYRDGQVARTGGRSRVVKPLTKGFVDFLSRSRQIAIEQLQSFGLPVNDKFPDDPKFRDALSGDDFAKRVDAIKSVDVLMVRAKLEPVFATVLRGLAGSTSELNAGQKAKLEQLFASVLQSYTQKLQEEVYEHRDFSLSAEKILDVDVRTGETLNIVFKFGASLLYAFADYSENTTGAGEFTTSTPKHRASVNTFIQDRSGRDDISIDRQPGPWGGRIENFAGFRYQEMDQHVLEEARLLASAGAQAVMYLFQNLLERTPDVQAQNLRFVGPTDPGVGLREELGFPSLASGFRDKFGVAANIIYEKVKIKPAITEPPEGRVWNRRYLKRSAFVSTKTSNFNAEGARAVQLEMDLDFDVPMWFSTS